jgi:CheY-like chemotaxis protein
LQLVGEVSDGLQAVRTAEELQPDLIVLDIGLPSLNGIEVARRIRKLSPRSKILFVSQESSADLVREALGTGAHGYVVKTDAGRELLEGVSAVLRGEQFVGKRFSGQDFIGGSQLQQNMKIARRHDVGFYSNDAGLLDDLAEFIEAALRAGNAAIVVATESHRDSLLSRLHAHGSEIRTAIEQGRYILLDAAEALSTFMVNDLPDPVRVLTLLGDLIVTAAEAAEGGRVAVFGECVDLLSEQGKAEAVIRLEQLWNEISKSYDVNILCGYHLSTVEGGMDSHVFQRICAEHTAVCSR